jgi:hypothetical protein
MANDGARSPSAPTRLVQVLARLAGQRAIYGVLVNPSTHPGTILGVAGPLEDAASRHRFLAGEVPVDPARAAWGQRQHWAFPVLAMRLAPVLGNEAETPAAGGTSLPKTASYRQEYVRCGKRTCTSCRTGSGHGPYWYAYWRQGGQVHKRYLGKQLPPSGGENGETPAHAPHQAASEAESKRKSEA